MKRGGGPPPDGIFPVFVINQESRPVSTKAFVPLKPFIAAARSDLLHSRQDRWECLLLAFRAATRSRTPTLAMFMQNLRSTGRIRNVDECAESGIPVQFLRLWVSEFCGNYTLQVVRRHQWSNKFVVEHFFETQVIPIIAVVIFLTFHCIRLGCFWCAFKFVLLVVLIGLPYTAILRVSDSMSDQTEALEIGYWRQNRIVAVLQVLQVMVKDT